MGSRTLQYDAAIGGSCDLPNEVSTFRTAGESLCEIKAMMEALRRPVQTKLVFQTLPKHMRRRVMSHNPKRLPVKFRVAHINQMKKSGAPAPKKRPSRKYRRKPSNLLREYMRRQMRNVWLETHIWHAKRFHMVERWGYKLPLAPCDKSFRACYRASSEHCLLQDISYIGCIEVSGQVDCIRQGFARMTSTECGLTIMAKCYMNALREGSLELYRKDAYPSNALGRVQFMWRPMDEDEQRRTVWIFAHAAFYRELVQELTAVFELKEVQSSETTEAVKRNPLDRTARFENASSHIALLELRNTFNRFRLTGPLSQAVLGKALRIASVAASASANTWLSIWTKNEANANAHNEQERYWTALRALHSPAEAPPYLVLALNIEDPRLSRPAKRTKARCVDARSPFVDDTLLEVPPCASRGAFWDMPLRNELLSTMMTTHEMCTKRAAELFVPGERAAFESAMQSVPVLLVQCPGSTDNNFKRRGYGSGWDLLVPAGYGLSMWMCLVMWGARTGGLREMRSVTREMGEDEFMPDTVAGTKDDERRHRMLRDSYFQKPQNKRPNFRKLAIASPFRCLWPQLVSEWCPARGDGDFFVIRNKALLQQIKDILKRGKGDLARLNLPPKGLVPVYLTMDRSGSPGAYSLLCLPKKSDQKRNLHSKKYREHNPAHTEPLRPDKTESERKATRTQHLRLLRRLRNARVRAKRRAQQTATTLVRIAPAATQSIIAEQFKRMCELWLPESPMSVRNQCSREVIGFATQAEFSFTESRVAAVGFVVAQSLAKLLASSALLGRSTLLLRGTCTRDYRLAHMRMKI